MDLKKRFSEEQIIGFLKQAEAGLGDDVVMYSLRHCAISEMLVAGIDPLSVARLAGTSIAMIQNHYGHLIKDKVATQLASVKMI